MSEKKDLAASVDQFNFEAVTQKLMATRKVVSETEVTYEEVEHSMGDKILKLRGTHVPLDDVYKYASGSCKVCSYGKGYYISNIPKIKYPQPTGLMVLEAEIPEGLSEDQVKIYEAKIAKDPNWKIINVCRCASEKALRKNPTWVATGTRTVYIALDYNFEDKPSEEKTEEKIAEKKEPVEQIQE